MKKRILALILCLAFAFSFAACDNPKPSGESDTPDSKPDYEVEFIDLQDDTAGKIANTLPLFSDYFDLDNAKSFYDERYKNNPFYSNSEDCITYLCNALWDVFGADNQMDKNVSERVSAQSKVIDKPTGDNSAWANIDATKFAWNAGTYKLQVKSVLRNWPIRSDGYLWSWRGGKAQSETWGGAGYSDAISGFHPAYHFDQQLEWVSAVREICVWEGNTSFLEQVDDDRIANSETTTIVIKPPYNAIDNVSGNITYYYEDVSKGMTVREKLESVVAYIMREDGSEIGVNGLGGASGIIKLPVDNNIAVNLQTPAAHLPTDNIGGAGSGSSNIWDDLPFGWYDPYEGALFLTALEALAEIYALDGKSAESVAYAELYSEAVEKYDAKYWNEQTGRYLTNISRVEEGGVWKDKALDLGCTFVGNMALCSGAGNSAKADTYFDWIDGRRIVSDDSIKGNYIVDRYKFATVTNTVPVEAATGVLGGDWWHAPGGLSLHGIGRFGSFLENGGAIFYTSYYENMARCKWGKADSALKRLYDIAEEYNVDGLDRDNPVLKSGSESDFTAIYTGGVNTSGVWIGCAGEYPENGLVPLIYLKGFMGVNARYDGLHIEPNMPQGFGDMGARQVEYAGNVLDLHIYKDDCVYIRPQSKGKPMKIVISDFVSGNGNYFANIDGKDYALTENGDGFSITLPAGFGRVKIYKK